MNPLVAGAAGGLAANVAGNAVYDALKGEESSLVENSHGAIPDHYRVMIAQLSAIEANLRQAAKENAPEVVQKVVLSPIVAIDFNDRGYDHCWLFTPVPQKILMSIQGTAPYTFTSVPGWNAFDIPNKTALTGDPVGAQQQVITLFFSNVGCNMPGIAS